MDLVLNIIDPLREIIYKAVRYKNVLIFVQRRKLSLVYCRFKPHNLLGGFYIILTSERQIKRTYYFTDASGAVLFYGCQTIINENRCRFDLTIALSLFK